jgi:antitoxin FitA
MDETMAVLTVRNVEDELVRRLKRRAVEEGVSAEELHRRILRRALNGPRRTGADLAAALRKLGELGLEVEPDRRSEPPKVEF